MSEVGSEALTRFLAQRPDSALLIDAATTHVEPGTWERVAVAVADRQALRALAVPAGVRSAAIAVQLAAGTGALALVPRPEWPPMTAIRARPVGEGWLTVIRFSRPLGVAGVVAELGRQSVWSDRAGNRGLVVQAGPEIAADVPPDVLVSQVREPHSPLPELVEIHPVSGRAPLVLRDPGGPAWLGPLDERVLNPIGFAPAASAPVVDLARLETGGGPTERLVGSLRDVLGVRVAFPDPADRDLARPLARTVAGLAMAGVPLTIDPMPPAHRQHLGLLLGEAVTSALEADVDLGDALAREEHSVVLRRAALGTFSSFAWRGTLGELAGVRVAVQPAVSVVLATRRPEQLEFALRQVAKQRGVDHLELVLAPHGFDVDPARVRSLVGEAITVQVVGQPDTTLFGDVLAAAASAAGGDVVLKMDDDDWYGPDVIGDLLLARAYSGAQLVGMPAEFHYLAPRRVTVKRGHRTELYARFVAGGTMLVEAAMLREVGSFRSVRKFVDAQLLAAVSAAGGAVYRTHGLGYLLRRNASGHTWEVDMDYLLDPSRVETTWDGFRPSRLLELDEAELPA